MNTDKTDQKASVTDFLIKSVSIRVNLWPFLDASKSL